MRWKASHLQTLLKVIKMNFLDQTQIEHMLKHYPANRNLHNRNSFGIFLMACLTGLKQPEILQLKFRDVHADQLYILKRNSHMPITPEIKLLIGQGEPDQPIFIGAKTSVINNDLAIIMIPLGVHKYIVMHHVNETHKNFLKHTK